MLTPRLQPVIDRLRMLRFTAVMDQRPKDLLQRDGGGRPSPLIGSSKGSYDRSAQVRVRKVRKVLKMLHDRTVSGSRPTKSNRSGMVLSSRESRGNRVAWQRPAVMT